jgi:F-type H+-transporting ATPase subunit delta
MHRQGRAEQESRNTVARAQEEIRAERDRVFQELRTQVARSPSSWPARSSEELDPTAHTRSPTSTSTRAWGTGTTDVADDALIEGYAQALFAVAHAEGVLSKVEDELYAFGMALGQHTDLRDALTDASLPTENKKAVVHDVLGDRANPVTVSLLGFVIDAGRAREIPKIVEELAGWRPPSGSTVAEVRSAVELTAEQRDRLAQALSEATGRKVDVKVVVDPSVIGGVVARVGDEVFDGSIANRLEDAKQALGSV